VNPNIFILSGRISYRRLAAGLREDWRLRGQSEILEECTYMDTFDWRLFNAGTLLETVHNNKGWRLEWRAYGETSPQDGCLLLDRPRFAADIGNPAVRNRLAEVIGVRALLPLVSLRCRRRHLQLLDDEGKNLLTLQFEKDESQICERQPGNAAIPCRSDWRVRLMPMKGYEEIADAVRTRLLSAGFLNPVTRDPLLDYLAACGITPDNNRLVPVITPPDERTDTAIRKIQRLHLERMQLQEAGIRQDIDSEFLHEFRVAVRRTRAFLGQSKGVIPSRRLSRFKRDFAWLGQSSGVARDMDVHLQAVEHYRAILPSALHDGLAPIQAYLMSRRNLEYGRMRRVLDSVRYRNLCRDWNLLLMQSGSASTTLPHARQTITEFARHRIWRTFRKARRQGQRIDVDRDTAGLHRLRKTVKKLRYLTDSFHYLLPPQKLRPLIRGQKSLQEKLGQLQDHQVQKRRLEEIRLVLLSQTGVSEATATALDLLIAYLDEGNRKARRRFGKEFRQFSAADVRQRYRQLSRG